MPCAAPTELDSYFASMLQTFRSYGAEPCDRLRTFGVHNSAYRTSAFLQPTQLPLQVLIEFQFISPAAFGRQAPMASQKRRQK